MGVARSIGDSPTQMLGRFLILCSALLLLVYFDVSSRGVTAPRGSDIWWRAVPAGAFNSQETRPGAWLALAIFALGSALNARSFWSREAGFRFSIRRLMAVVMIAAVVCLGLRLEPILGLIMILIVALRPAWLVGIMRRRQARRQDRVRS